jgi:hypothetical protein
MLEGDEVSDPGTERDLSSEFQVRELPRSKQLPKIPLGFSQLATKHFRLYSFELINAILRHFPLTRLAH